MSHEGSAPADPPIRRVALRHAGPAFVVSPPVPAAGEPAAARAFAPFVLPRLPVNTAHWLSAVGHRLWRDRRACLALALRLDCAARRWTWPAVPTQRCGPDRPAWSLIPADYADVPDDRVRVAGSYQLLGSRLGPFAAAALVPAFDGLHIVDQPAGGAERAFYFFARHGGQTELADPAGVLVDDLAAMLRDHAGRLRFA